MARFQKLSFVCLEDAGLTGSDKRCFECFASLAVDELFGRADQRKEIVVDFRYMAATHY